MTAVRTIPRSRHRQQVVDDLPPRLAVVITADEVFANALAERLQSDERAVVIGPDASALLSVEGWLTEWRDLAHLDGVIVDLAGDILGGVDALDAIRRRDPCLFVMLVSRNRRKLKTARLGANLIVEGRTDAARIAALFDTR